MPYRCCLPLLFWQQLLLRTPSPVDRPCRRWAPSGILILCYVAKTLWSCRNALPLPASPFPGPTQQEVGDKERLVASLTEQIAAADAEHAQAKARRNEAQDARKEAWREADELSEQHKAAEAEYSKAFEVSLWGRQAAVWRLLCSALCASLCVYASAGWDCESRKCSMKSTCTLYSKAFEVGGRRLWPGQHITIVVQLDVSICMCS
jgi:hypothetical protein